LNRDYGFELGLWGIFGISGIFPVSFPESLESSSSRLGKRWNRDDGGGNPPTIPAIGGDPDAQPAGVNGGLIFPPPKG